MLMSPLVSILLLLTALTSSTGATQQGAKPRLHTETATFVSQPFTIDRIYKSMQGPTASQYVTITKDNPPELLWITGYHVTVVNPDGHTPTRQEFMCHNNLNFIPKAHAQLLGWSHTPNNRMFTLSQGQFSIKFPEGFGVPVMSNETFEVADQVLNHNIPQLHEVVRNKVEVEFVRDRNLTTPLKPLFPENAFVMALLAGKDGYYGVDQPTGLQEHSACLPGEQAPGITTDMLHDKYGRVLSGHFVVPRGRSERKTLVTKWLHIPYDTTVHFIAVHVHPFCESLALRDLNTGKTLFKSTMRGPKKGIGLENVSYFSSEKGIPVYKDHEYEMVSVYQNSSGENQDAMATFFLYLLDKEFKKPNLVATATQPPSPVTPMK